MRKKALGVIVGAFLLISCRCIAPDLALRYDPLGPAVLQATRLLLAEYPDGPPSGYTGEMYVDLLQKNHYDEYHDILSPYQVQIAVKEKAFIARVYDGSARILIDWSETDGRIDCWCYTGECKDDGLHKDPITRLNEEDDSLRRIYFAAAFTLSRSAGNRPISLRRA